MKHKYEAQNYQTAQGKRVYKCNGCLRTTVKPRSDNSECKSHYKKARENWLGRIFAKGKDNLFIKHNAFIK